MAGSFNKNEPPMAFVSQVLPSQLLVGVILNCIVFCTTTHHFAAPTELDDFKSKSSLHVCLLLYLYFSLRDDVFQETCYCECPTTGRNLFCTHTPLDNTTCHLLSRCRKKNRASSSSTNESSCIDIIGCRDMMNLS